MGKERSNEETNLSPGFLSNNPAVSPIPADPDYKEYQSSRKKPKPDWYIIERESIKKDGVTPIAFFSKSEADAACKRWAKAGFRVSIPVPVFKALLMEEEVREVEELLNCGAKHCFFADNKDDGGMHAGTTCQCLQDIRPPAARRTLLRALRLSTRALKGTDNDY